MSNIVVSQISAYTPSNIVSNDDISKIVETNDEWIFSRTGIKNRRISLNENTSDLCAKVCKDLIEKEGIDPKEIDLIIVATITPDALMPSVSCMVQSIINAENAMAFDINVACTGFVYAISIAEKMMKSGLYKTALVVGGETLSKMVDWTDRGTCCLFGDGAGGILLKQGNENFLICEELRADGKRGLSLTGKNIPLSNYWVDGKPASEFMQMQGRDIFDFAAKAVPQSILSVMEKSGLTFDEIDYIVPHQANSRIIDFVAKKLKLEMDKFFMNISEYGNTSAASIPIALSEMLDKNLIKIGSGQKLILAGFGGGLTWGSVIIKL